MNAPSNDPFSRRLFQTIIQLYPAEFRQRFGPELLQLFDDISGDASGSPRTSVLSLPPAPSPILQTAPSANNSTGF